MTCQQPCFTVLTHGLTCLRNLQQPLTHLPRAAENTGVAAFQPESLQPSINHSHLRAHSPHPPPTISPNIQPAVQSCCLLHTPRSRINYAPEHMARACYQHRCRAHSCSCSCRHCCGCYRCRQHCSKQPLQRIARILCVAAAVYCSQLCTAAAVYCSELFTSEG